MTWIQTYTGRKFSLVDPQPEDVDLVDIIASLSHLCRFGGHCHHFYSVAEHSIRVAEIVPREDRLAALLHDAGEAYYGDVTRPLKKLRLGDLPTIVSNIDAAIAIHFGMPLGTLPAAVRHADDVLLATEARDLMTPPPQKWDALPSPLEATIVPSDMRTVRHRFFEIYCGCK